MSITQFSRKKTVLFLFASHAVLLFVCLLYKFVFDYTDGAAFSCVFYESFGIRCMGCGGSRSLMALLDFNFLKSFLLYPPILITSAFILDFDIRAVLSVKLGTPSPIKSFKLKYIVIIPISILLTFLIRLAFLFVFNIDLVTLAASF